MRRTKKSKPDILKKKGDKKMKVKSEEGMKGDREMKANEENKKQG